ncbi:predicted protein [Phaeodactylum tricornutum CCAP 1055/1]|jgi:hypothetical protein|uniref:Uncharacterized protein n=1 Tax=Phaeodactylum tricornutum (strain CCAP 1055/1) TaxID=556484 RepID=B7G790_PHATC|nr:predicted protein [Phaeodactylum tricornutum CCAP 1055/1]EEC45602.1 predicted protein [Phaeodactylum tricornutum CCAP 1055/1]|eukprot:XP_002182866.1 predicted protein [Phaeodactylum tricornutum CCAP 1055/1]
MPSGVAITIDLERIVQQQKSEQSKRDYQAKNATPPQAEETTPEGFATSTGWRRNKKEIERTVDSPEEETVGTYKKQSMKPPQPSPNMLNKEMAEAAAVRYRKNEKNIQKACKKIDDPGAKGGCACAIL